MLTQVSQNILSLSDTLDMVIKARDLDTLNLIDQTVESLQRCASFLRFHTAIIRQEIDRAHNSPEVIDADGTLVPRLEAIRDKLGEIHAALKLKHQAACDHPHLQDDDCVADAYAQVIDAAAGMHNMVNDLCWAIGERDADLEQGTIGPFTSVDALLDALK